MKYNDLIRTTKFNRREAQLNQLDPVYRTPEITLRNISDREGLNRATASSDKLYVHGDTLFVAGTSSWQDAWDDLKIPFHQTWRAQRYIDADRVLKNNPQIKNLVGHSLGGAVVLELQNDHPDKTFKTDTYGAPEASITGPDDKDNHRYRNFMDPISFLDRGAASTNQITLNPLQAHSYENFDVDIEKRGYTQQTDFVDLEK
jgi:pimeloyl-ACP methyl ester carboxylesterase